MKGRRGDSGAREGIRPLETHVLFFMAAVVAGLINSLAGGGGLITFPLLALVVPPVVADATSALALLPAYPGAVWRTRRKLRDVPRLWLWLLLVTSALGGLVGALLLVWTSDRNFLFLVPWLVFGGTVLFALEPWLSRRGSRENRGLATRLWPLAVAVVFVVAIYGGYFGAGIGILMISALSLLRMGDVHRVVPFKNLLAGCLRGVAVVVLVIYGEINWGYGVPMAVGGLIGGYLGGALTGRINSTVLRAVVMSIGFGLAAYYFWTLYGSRGYASEASKSDADKTLSDGGKSILRPRERKTGKDRDRIDNLSDGVFAIVISFLSVSLAIWSWLVMLVADGVVVHRRFRKSSQSALQLVIGGSGIGCYRAGSDGYNLLCGENPHRRSVRATSSGGQRRHGRCLPGIRQGPRSARRDQAAEGPLRPR